MAQFRRRKNGPGPRERASVSERKSGYPRKNRNRLAQENGNSRHQPELRGSRAERSRQHCARKTTIKSCRCDGVGRQSAASAIKQQVLRRNERAGPGKGEPARFILPVSLCPFHFG